MKIKTFNNYFLNENEIISKKLTKETAKDCPKSIVKKIYDKDDNVLFGSHYTKGKVSYMYVPGEYMESGNPYIIGSEVSYDGKGNKEGLPNDAILKNFEELPEMFPDNKFE